MAAIRRTKAVRRSGVAHRRSAKGLRQQRKAGSLPIVWWALHHSRGWKRGFPVALAQHGAGDTARPWCRLLASRVVGIRYRNTVSRRHPDAAVCLYFAAFPEMPFPDPVPAGVRR